MAELTAVAIVEDDTRMRESVRQIIDAEDDFRCRGAYGSAEQALRALGGAPAELLLLDIHLPGMQGSEAVRLFHERFPAMPIVMFTVFDDDRRIFTSICNGASGYVLKKTPPAKLLDALRAAVRRLRAKADDPFGHALIHTVRGAGYVLEDRS